MSAAAAITYTKIGYATPLYFAKRIDTTCEVINDRFKDELAMWRSLGRL